MKIIKSFLKKILLICNITINKKNEPHYNLFNLIKSSFFNELYFGFNKTNLLHNPEVYKDRNYTVIRYNERNYFYPEFFSLEKANKSFRNILFEQSLNHPHRYNYEKIDPRWVVYDFGAAEGYQTSLFLENGNKVIAFEPNEDFYKCLLKTFENEIKSKQLIVFKRGISKNKHEKIYFSDLQSLVVNLNIPPPNYIKADIEGEEITLLDKINHFVINGTLKFIDITTYHAPDHVEKIPTILNKFKGPGNFSDGIIVLNINTWALPGNYKTLFQPVFRKVLYSKSFL